MSNSSIFVQEQDREAVLRTAETLKGELESLQLLNERLNGESLDDLTYPELWSLERQLSQGMFTVERQADKAEMELIAKQVLRCEISIGWGNVMRERLRRREESISRGEMLKGVSGQTEHGQSSMDNAIT